MNQNENIFDMTPTSHR